MYHKIGVTPGEMLELREQGLSNHDIAKELDISYQTVVRYIGKQGRRMEGLAAFKDTPLRRRSRRYIPCRIMRQRRTESGFRLRSWISN